MDIFQAVLEGDEGAILKLLAADPTLLDMADSRDHIPLTLAAEHGQLGVIRLLLQRGSDINAPGNQLGTALHFAAGGGHEEMVTFLLDKGAEANSRMFDDRTPLIYASANGHVGVVETLVQHRGGEGLEERDWHGKTALHHAAGMGHEEIVAFLLAQGAGADLVDVEGVTPLMCGCGDGHLEVVEMLLQHTGGQGLGDADRDGCTALHYAASWGYEEVVRFLLAAGADPCVRDNEGRTPCELAQVAGHEGCVEVFEVSGPCLDEALPVAHSSDRMPLPGESAGLKGAPVVPVAWQWWDGEIERRAVLQRATRLHKAYTTQRDMPTSQAPTYLKARVAAGHALPVVEVVSPQAQEQQPPEQQQAGAGGKRKAEDEQEEAQEAKREAMRHAMLEYVVTGLNQELLKELLEGFHGP